MLRPGLVNLINHTEAAGRAAAVLELAELARSDDVADAAAARTALQRLTEDESERVRVAAARALEDTAIHRSPRSIDLGNVPANRTEGPAGRAAVRSRRTSRAVTAVVTLIVVVTGFALAQLLRDTAGHERPPGGVASASSDPAEAVAAQFVSRIPADVRKLGCHTGVFPPPNPYPYAACGSVNGLMVKYYLHSSAASMNQQFRLGRSGDAPKVDCSRPSDGVSTYRRGPHHGRIECSAYGDIAWTDESTLTSGELSEYNVGDQYDAHYKLWTAAIQIAKSS